MWQRFRFASPTLIENKGLEVIDVYPPRFWDSHNGALNPYTYGHVDRSDPILVWLKFQGRHCTLVISLWPIHADSRSRSVDALRVLSWLDDIEAMKNQMSEIPKSFSVSGKPHWERRNERQKAFSDFLGTKFAADNIGCELLEIQRDFSKTYVMRLFLRDHEAEMQL
jgi:hypothetical protein